MPTLSGLTGVCPWRMGRRKTAGTPRSVESRLVTGIFRRHSPALGPPERRLDGGIHEPLLSTLAAEPVWSQERLRALLFGEPLADLQGQSWGKGAAKGPLIAANLTVASHLLGSPHMPDLTGAILILEDVPANFPTGWIAC